ncbi:uncharacterized protein [Leptinotarsa decemlineata]|uniref:uncharacterized protein n=1 Tax=Leptinotarsa decemlineata TaxID=7539 RepID=UPI003D30ABB7
MMDSSDFDADIFIEAIKSRPIIWNTTLPEYHDKIKKKDAWTEVCSLMCNGFEEKSEKEQNDIGTEYMKKWKGMRDTFMKSVKKKTVSGQGASNRLYI